MSSLFSWGMMLKDVQGALKWGENWCTFHATVMGQSASHHHRHLRVDFGGLLQYAGPFVELHGREQQPHLPEHSGAVSLS